MDVSFRSRFSAFAAVAWLSACGGTPQGPTSANRAPVAQAKIPDPDLNPPPIKKLLAIDWARVALATDADALAVWAQIAPTGFDWESKLMEVPEPAARRLAIALLRGGNFTCAKPAPPSDCAAPVFQVPEPAHAAGFRDPCLRRLLALWSIEQLGEADLIHVVDAYTAIAAIPPPESQLLVAMLRSVPESEQAWLVELIATASRAGHREVVTTGLSQLEPDSLVTALTRHHISGALDILPASAYRQAFFAALGDEAIPGPWRARALVELVDLVDGEKLPPDLQTALVKATSSKDCLFAAVAARALAQHGQPAYVPKRPQTRSPAAMMRALCVHASYEALQSVSELPQRHLEHSKVVFFDTFVPPRGLEIRRVAYDALSEEDLDGNGDPHTTVSLELQPRVALLLPEAAEIARAMKRCTGTTCTSDDFEFRFTFRPHGGPLLLTRIDMIERPPCVRQ